MYNIYLSKCFEIGTRLGLEHPDTINAYQLLEIYERTQAEEVGRLINVIHRRVMK